MSKTFFKENLLFILLLFLFFVALKFNFNIQSMYTNRELAQNYVNNQLNLVSNPYDGDYDISLDNYINPFYNIVNIAYTLFATILNALVFMFFFNIKTFKGFKNIEIFNDKLIIFTWINTSYFLFAYIAYKTIENELTETISTSLSDSTGILLMSAIFILSVIAIVLYVVMNIFFILVFCTKIKHKIIMYLGYFAALFMLGILLIFGDGLYFLGKIYSVFFYMFWFYLLYSALITQKAKIKMIESENE